MSDKNATPEQTPLAIIGIGCLFPKAGGLKEYWANIKGKVDAIGEVPASHWSASDYFDADPKKPDHTYARRGGFLKPVDFDPAEFGITPSALEATDSAQLLGLVTAGMALKDAGYGPERSFDRSRVSVILGVTGTLELVVPLGARLGHPIWRKALSECGITGEQAEAVVSRIADGYVPWQENSFPGLLGNVVAGRIANRFNLGGTNCVVDAACASSLSAAHLASLELSNRRSTMVVAGGVDCFNDIFMYMCFSKTPALSPTGDAKPFDASADGTILGEGLGMVVLKRLDEAQKDGDKIYAVLKGVGSSSDGRGKSIYAPSPEGQTKALREAYRVSGVSPATVELVEAHGTGTTVGDGAELAALNEVYREARADGTWAALGSVKSMIGHTKAAAGAAGMIKAAMSLHHKVFPPTIKVKAPLAPLASGDSPFYLSLEKRPWFGSVHPRRAAISALGFGGSNFHAILEEYSPAKVETDWDGSVELAAFSGPDAPALAGALSSWSGELAWDDLRAKAFESRVAFKADAPCRLVLTLERGQDHRPLVSAALARLAKGEAAWSLPEGAFYGSGPRRKLGLLFPGQGSQYVGMGRDLACQFPEAHGAFAEADRHFPDGRLTDLVYPKPALAAEKREAQELALRQTDKAQPALGACGLAAWRVLQGFGVSPDAAAGHSYGELAALCAAGVLSSEELFRLSRLRGSLMAQGDGGRGGMLAVQASRADIDKVVAEEKLDLVLANKNAPSQSVLSGRKEEIARAAEAFSRRGLRGVILPVSAAFHSPLVAGAEAPFRAGLEKTPWGKAAFPVYANKTARAYAADAASGRALLAGQLAAPVEFSALVEAMHASGVSIFLEAGPGARLSGLVSAILGDKASVLSLDASSGRKSGAADLARALAFLAASGQPLTLSAWEGGEAAGRELLARKKPKMTVKLSGANYRASRPSAKPFTPRPAAALPAAPATGDLSTKFPRGNNVDNAAPAPASPFLSEALRSAQESLAALQRMQEQTALLHQRFLESQEAAQVSLQAVLAQQQALLGLPAAAPVVVSAGRLEARPGSDGRAGSRARLDAERPGRDDDGRGGGTSPAAPAADTAAVDAVLLAVVSEKTGYPAETLNADMDLESDLGIDSIKRVEILSAIHERLPGSPKVKPEHLGTLRTLKQIAAFLNNGVKPQITQITQITATEPSASSAPSAVDAVLLSVVSEKTGYPAETLNQDMDLESDLGIDSIKRVEILSAIHERLPGSPKVKPEHLGTLRTLKQIAAFLSNGVKPQITQITATEPSASSAPSAVDAVLLSVVSEKTGYPAETLNQDMDLESDLGIDSIKRVEILSAVSERLPGSPKVKPEHLGTLRTLKQIAAFLSDGGKPQITQISQITAAEPSASSAPSAVRRSVLSVVPWAERMRAPVKIAGPVLIVDEGEGLAQALVQSLKRRGQDARALAWSEAEKAAFAGPMGGLVILAPRRKAPRGAFWSPEGEALLKRALSLAKTAASSGPTAFMTVSRLDGAFGLSGAADEDCAQGGLAGLAKTAGREWPQAACKAVDADAAWTDASALAEALAEELLLSGPDEIGLSASGRRVLSLAEEPAREPGPLPFGKGDVVLVTGGARGVTAACAVALAQAAPATYVLLGRSPKPAAEPEWLSSCRTEGEIQKAFLAREGKLAPRELGRRCREVLAAREIRETLRLVKAAGAEAVYLSADGRDAAAAAEAVRRARDLGPVRGLVHGAGVLADKLIADKAAEQWDPVLDTKLASLRHILAALELSELKAAAFFTSTSARLGRLGQVDYAMANEALNKAAQALARRLPSCRVAALNWGPWDGGMVTEAHKKIFASEGVAVIGLAAGAALLRAELSGPGAVEVVVLGGDGRSEAPAPAALQLAFERPLSLEEHPFLQSHVIGGRPVLPLAVTLEWLAHGALHGHPGLRFHGVDELRVLKGVRLNGGPAPLSVWAGKAVKEGGFWSVPVELRGQDGARHAAARVVLAAALPNAAPALPPLQGPAGPSLAKAYGELLFHGPDMQFLLSVDALSAEGVSALARTALPPSAWLRRPPRERWLADPAALDAAFQAMILWTWDRMGSASLPSFAGRYRQYREAFPEKTVRVSARVLKRLENLVRADIEFTDEAGALVARIEGYECTVDASLNEAFRRSSAAPALKD